MCFHRRGHDWRAVTGNDFQTDDFEKQQMILAGDIGGTSPRLGLFEIQNGSLRLINTRTFPSRNYGSLCEIASAFLSDNGRPLAKAACFGVAGPVNRGRVVGPNLAWDTHALTLARELGIESVKLINDLEANAYGIAALTAADLVTLQAGNPNTGGNAAVISAGTGLGEAGLFWDGNAHIPFACEGGHVDFAPRNELESELLLYLRAKFGRVSYERVLSGNGQQLLYEFLRDVKGYAETPVLMAEMRSGNPSAVITRAGLEKSCGLCVRALDWYVSLYGAEAGNLALKTMATGGVYIGGGIAPKIVQKLKEPAFIEAFVSKGRMKELLGSIPVRVIMNDQTALLGAARVAARLVSFEMRQRLS
jgi:glucokinase